MSELGTMNKQVKDLRDRIVLGMLPGVPFDGWTWDGAYTAAQEAGLQEEIITALFPDGLCDVVAHFSDMMDRDMLRALTKVNTAKMRTRDRIQTAVEARFDALTPHKDAIRLALAYWSVPPRHLRAGRIVWRTADRIWDFAGDTSTDYNRHTKRALLAGILTATTLVWLKDTTDEQQTTKDFLSRRIENVLQFGQILGKLKPRA